MAHSSSVSEAIFANSGNSLVGEPPLQVSRVAPGPGDTLPHAMVIAEKSEGVSVAVRPLAPRSRVPPPPVRGGPRREPLELTPDEDDET